MRVFLDTSGLYPAVSATDARHHEAAASWRKLIQQESALVTSSYVVLECLPLLKRRHGVERAAHPGSVLDQVVDVHWVDRGLHRAGSARVLRPARPPGPAVNAEP